MEQYSVYLGGTSWDGEQILTTSKTITKAQLPFMVKVSATPMGINFEVVDPASDEDSTSYKYLKALDTISLLSRQIEWLSEVMLDNNLKYEFTRVSATEPIEGTVTHVSESFSLEDTCEHVESTDWKKKYQELKTRTIAAVYGSLKDSVSVAFEIPRNHAALILSEFGPAIRERIRQIDVEHYSIDDDAHQINNDLAKAAAAYITPHDDRDYINVGKPNQLPRTWPFSWQWKFWKPTPDNRLRELEKGMALAAAEYGRYLRKSK